MSLISKMRDVNFDQEYFDGSKILVPLEMPHDVIVFSAKPKNSIIYFTNQSYFAFFWYLDLVGDLYFFGVQKD
jgi:hypothetical protein